MTVGMVIALLALMAVDVSTAERSGDSERDVTDDAVPEPA